MTPFMLQVAALVGTPADEVEPVAPMPTTRISERIATSTGADRHVAIRSLAEQLVCEANAVLAAAAESDDRLSLHDETLPSELAFNVAHRGCAARVSMTFEDGTAYGRLVGDGFESDLPRELAGPDDLPALLIRLLVESGFTRRQTAARL